MLADCGWKRSVRWTPPSTAPTIGGCRIISGHVDPSDRHSACAGALTWAAFRRLASARSLSRGLYDPGIDARPARWLGRCNRLVETIAQAGNQVAEERLLCLDAVCLATGETVVDRPLEFTAELLSLRRSECGDQVRSTDDDLPVRDLSFAIELHTRQVFSGLRLRSALAVLRNAEKSRTVALSVPTAVDQLRPQAVRPAYPSKQDKLAGCADFIGREAPLHAAVQANAQRSHLCCYTLPAS